MKAIPQEHLGTIFRSRTEARWAEYFRLGAVKWSYEPEGYDFGPDRYVPDFLLPFSGAFFEIKPDLPTERECRVASSVAVGCRTVVVIAAGNPSSTVELIGFGPNGQARQLYLSPDAETHSPWLCLDRGDHDQWAIPLSESCVRRYVLEDAIDMNLDEAGRLQFSPPRRGMKSSTRPTWSDWA